MGSFTHLANNAILASMFGARSQMVASSHWRVGLSTAKANKDCVVVEPPASANYSRAVYPNDPSAWSTPINGVIFSKRSISFAVPSADWGKLMSIFIANEAGDIVAQTDLTTPKTVRHGDDAPAPWIAPAAFLISLD